jgi:hypothetical protein
MFENLITRMLQLQLSQAAPELLKQVLKCNADLPATLRGTSIELRDAVNKTVSVVKIPLVQTYGSQTDLVDITSELATTFTNARSLILDFRDATSTTPMTSLLRRLQETSPELLKNLQSLSVTIEFDHAMALGSYFLIEFLRR